MDDVAGILVDESNEKVLLLIDGHIHKVRCPYLIWATRFFKLFAVPFLSTAMTIHQVFFEQNAIHRRWAQERYVIIDHSPCKLSMADVRVR